MKRITKGEEGGIALTNVLKDVDDEERGDQVVDALHVAAGRVADCPNKQDALKNLAHTTKKTQCQKVCLNTKYIYIIFFNYNKTNKRGQC